MIDVDFSKIGEQKLGTMPILILKDFNANYYCTINNDYARTIHQVHSPTFSLDYRALYSQLGCLGFKEYLIEYLKKNNILIIYFRDVPSSEIELSFIEELRKDYYIFCYLGDILEHFDSYYCYWGQVLDLVLVDDYYDKFLFKQYGEESLVLPPAYDAEMYAPIGIENKKYDVSFVGRMDRVGRKEFIDFLEENGIKVEVFGWGSKNGVVGKKEMIEIFNNSKINLNFTGPSNIFKNKIQSRVKQIKGHCQEIALTKSFVLTEVSPVIHRLFEIGSEIDVFYDKHDLLDKVNFYLKNDEQRKQMAEKAYRRSLRDLGACGVWERLLQLIYHRAKNKKYRSTDLIIDRGFSKSVCLSRIRYSIFFMRHLKFRLLWEEITVIVRMGGLFLIPAVICSQIIVFFNKLSRKVRKILSI